MGAAGPPSWLHWVISPVKTAVSWGRVSSRMGLSGWTTTATPSRAARWPAAPAARSASVSSRLDRPMSQVPASTASTPAPEPVPE